jgi:hypothetical protein
MDIQAPTLLKALIVDGIPTLFAETQQRLADTVQFFVADWAIVFRRREAFLPTSILNGRGSDCSSRLRICLADTRIGDCFWSGGSFRVDSFKFGGKKGSVGRQ